MCGSLLENGRFGGRRGPGAAWGLAGWASELKKVGTKRSYLQRSVPIQPKTSEMLPNFAHNRFSLRSSSRSPGQPLRPATSARRFLGWRSLLFVTTDHFSMRKHSFRNFAKFWRARSQLYRSRFLRIIIHVPALFEIYQFIILINRSEVRAIASGGAQRGKGAKGAGGAPGAAGRGPEATGRS